MWAVLEREKLLSLCILLLMYRFDFSIGLPVEQPTRFILNTADANANNVAPESVSGFNQGRELLGRFADAIRIGTGRFVNSVTLARNIIADRTETLASESQNNAATVIATGSGDLYQGQSFPQTTQYPPVTNTRPSARETVRLENETAQSLLEKPLPKPAMGVLESFLHPTPLLDGIKEEDKYGNTGDKFIGIGRALVNGFEGFSNFLNGIVDFPRNALKNTSRGITEALNHVGARFVGLE